MEKTSKFSSFSGREDSHQVHRNLSLNINADNLKPSKLDEQNEKIKEINQLACVFQQIDDFLLEKNPETTTLPLVAVDCLLIFVDRLIIDGKINDKDPKDTDNDNDGNHSHSDGDLQPENEYSILEAIDRISKVAFALEAFPSDPTNGRTAAVFQRSMAFLEEMFRSLLEENDSKFNKSTTGDNATEKTPENFTENSTMVPSSIDMEMLRRIASTMISSGYETECCQVFSITRREKLGNSLTELGFEMIYVEDLEKKTWDVLEKDITTWIIAFKHSVTVSLSDERRFCNKIFSDNPTVFAGLFSNLVRSIIIQLLNFSESVTSGKKSEEMLFKFLDMYETMRDLAPVVDSLFHEIGEKENDGMMPSSLLQKDLKSEMYVSKLRIGEAVVVIFSELETSIKSNAGKTPVPGGAVHPLTRYVMNYLKYACEYQTSLEQIFQFHHDKSEGDVPIISSSSGAGAGDGGDDERSSPFGSKLMTITDLLDENLNSQSRLYKDTSLMHIFLMNNGRYINQKVKESSSIHEFLGDQWLRKRRSNLRNHHTSYQRETWGNVFNCFKDEGLHVKGDISKPVLKERFKTFNTIFEDIHRTQSAWVVVDEQLQLELRVSVEAVVVPAYRSFLGRFRQYLEFGRHPNKYIKYAPEDLEDCIEQLFGGNQVSMIKRRS
ncbi:exocyst subunit exo70 family protein C1 [Zostera marina]|uniref:Exocyst subunit Exo70 family protein n=1 Tax=Zostera marina TaxID=29655 RepID=A0A0K9P5Y8_ZOSMR|nr:exocyst subunit exo70 family protein C1 [Zostera marina]